MQSESLQVKHKADRLTIPLSLLVIRIRMNEHGIIKQRFLFCIQFILIYLINEKINNNNNSLLLDKFLLIINSKNWSVYNQV